jgi:thioredoxin-like negative regulator of GroEL
MLGPVLEREEEAWTGRVALAKVDVDTNPGLRSSARSRRRWSRASSTRSST